MHHRLPRETLPTRRQSKSCTFMWQAVLVIFVVICAGVYALTSVRSSPTGGYVGKKIADILESEKKPVLGKSIFFHETSTNAGINLSPRQGCAIESAALNNPNSDIFVLFTTNMLGERTHSRVLEVLSNYSNIHFRSLNLFTYSVNTPAYEWLSAGKIFKSKYLKSHLSDFLRYLTLYKWGGTYLDLDVIVQRSLELMKPNFAGAESDFHVASGVMNLDYKNVGHRISTVLLKNLLINFDGTNWGTNGPGVITRVLRKICRTSVPAMMTRNRCKGFEVYPTSSFYAIPWQMWKDFFTPLNMEIALNRTHNSILVHVWNRHSANYPYFGAKVAYTVLAKKFCPQIYSALRFELR